MPQCYATESYERLYLIDKSLFYCKNCAKSFTRNEGFKKHINREHLGKKNIEFECSLCKKTFSEKPISTLICSFTQRKKSTNAKFASGNSQH